MAIKALKNWKKILKLGFFGVLKVILFLRCSTFIAYLILKGFAMFLNYKSAPWLVILRPCRWP